MTPQKLQKLQKLRQNAKILEADIAIAIYSVAWSQAELDIAMVQQEQFTNLAAQQAGSQKSVDEWTTRITSGEATLAQTQEPQKNERNSLLPQNRRGQHGGNLSRGRVILDAILFKSNRDEGAQGWDGQ